MVCDNCQVKEITVEGDGMTSELDLKNTLAGCLAPLISVRAFLQVRVSSSQSNSRSLRRKRSVPRWQRRETSPPSTSSASARATRTLCKRRNSSLGTTRKPGRLWRQTQHGAIQHAFGSLQSRGAALPLADHEAQPALSASGGNPATL